MCGVLSIYSPQKSVSTELLNKGICTLHHRGPDNQSIWLSDDLHVGLAHARLGIIDLESGNQPLSSHDGTIHLVVNGEFYDFEKIRRDLEADGAVFKTGSDSEIALHLYERKGVACLSELRGEFSLILWDQNTQTLFAARDRFGINPLFYAEHNGSLYLGSEIKALLAAGLEAKWDIDSYLHRSFFYQDFTLFAGIHQVPPGHFLIATPSGTRIHQYWDFDYPTIAATEHVDEQEAISRVREVLLDATKTRLRADVPVGVYLSGGVDSCAILGMASSLIDQKISTFTLAFEDSDYDESATARKMARHVGANHHEIPITQTEIADNFIDSIWNSETLCMNSHGAAKYILSREVQRQGFRVVLTGEGADEVFAGYPSFRSDVMRLLGNQASSEQRLRDTNKVTQGLHFLNSMNMNKTLFERFFGFTPSWIPPLMNIQDRISDLLSLKYEGQNYSQQAVFRFFNGLNWSKLKGISPLHMAMYGVSKTALPNYILTVLGDRMEMAHSLEGRLPYLDHHVVECVAKLPEQLKINSSFVEKYVMKEAVKPFVIDEVYNRSKHPFLAPPSIMDQKQRFYQLMQDSLRSATVRDIPFLEHNKVLKFVDGVGDTPQDEWPVAEAILLELMSLYSLQYHFKLSE